MTDSSLPLALERSKRASMRTERCLISFLKGQISFLWRKIFMWGFGIVKEPPKEAG